MNEKLNGRTTVSIKKVAHKRLKVLAAKEGKTIETLMDWIMLWGLKQLPNPKPHNDWTLIAREMEKTR
jgi:hypothetical protein